jgi:superfamily I DNA and RNA helicase
VQFLASLPTYGQDQAAKTIWGKLAEVLSDTDGICYYRHPVIVSTTKEVPDLTLLASGYQPAALKVCNFTLTDIEEMSETSWVIDNNPIDSPILELEDYVVGLQHKFSKERSLRNAFKAIGIIAFPLIAKPDFEKRFTLPRDLRVIWADLDVADALVAIDPLPERDWTLAKSVFQGVSPINRGSTINGSQTASTLGETIRILEKEIALLDEEQHKVAVQIAPGPQRIRGLAGTGKTVVLAMKAANLHLRYPDKDILFTFHTQSLYNQAKTLISKFYRIHSDEPPDWDKLHVMHGWGGVNRPGVYSEACKRAGQLPMTFPSARSADPAIPFRACCKAALQFNLRPIYDYVLVDEAQDFPREFFQLLYKMTTESKRICWAYDELQSLSSLEVPSPTELFGMDANGHPLISLEGEDYEGGIEKDFVLHRSYRCPQEVLMLAHGVGLGIHSPRGCVQMLANKSSWTSIGYEVIEGDLVTGEDTVIVRPAQNSPNRINQIYTGSEEIITVMSFESRPQEIEWVAEQIKKDVNEEGVRPDQIVVISLTSMVAKKYLTQLQEELIKHEIASTIPGLVNDTAEFAEPGMVTLSTVYRAKGNEAPVVYIISFDSLYEYTEEIERRNQAFASISRSKGWVRITGVGRPMRAAEQEIQKILNDIPNFKFKFPDIEHLRRLDASETSRRRREVRTAQESIRKLIGIDGEAIQALPAELLKKLKEKIEGASHED